jgi:hypothetical protein
MEIFNVGTEKIVNKKLKTMGRIKSLCYNINAFDASELLELALSEIRDQVDHVVAIWQALSYWKNPMDPEDMEELHRLQKIGLIDELVEFKPDFSIYARQQETDKRNMGINMAKEKGYSHVISADADELYDRDQLIEAKKTINKHGWPITYWSYINYYKDFDHYLVYPFRPFVNGIHSTYFTYTFNGPAPGPTDPTRRIYNPLNIGTYLFPDEVIRMCHGAWCRKNIRKKLENWSAKDHFNQELIDKAVEQFENWKEGDPAVMLFNVPDNSVVVRRLTTPIHKFKIPWLKEEIKIDSSIA